MGVADFSPVSEWGQGDYSVTDTTTKISNSGGSVSLSSSLPTVLWITVYIPGAGTTAGMGLIFNAMFLAHSSYTDVLTFYNRYHNYKPSPYAKWSCSNHPTYFSLCIWIHT